MNKVTIKTASGNIITEFTTEHDHFLVDVKPDPAVEITYDNYEQFIAPRVVGSFAYKAYYLDPDYNWELQKDYSGVLCLVPTKKE